MPTIHFRLLCDTVIARAFLPRQRLPDARLSFERARAMLPPGDERIATNLNALEENEKSAAWTQKEKEYRARDPNADYGDSEDAYSGDSGGGGGGDAYDDYGAEAESPEAMTTKVMLDACIGP